MKIVKVSYQKVFPLQQYVNEKIGVEIDLDTSKGDDANHAFDMAKQLVEKWHKENNPVIQETQPGEAPIPVIQVQKEEKAIGLYVEDIMSCKNVKVLESYAPLIKGNKKMQDAYERRREQLVSSPF
jgi:hypothetical protein